MSQYSSSDVFIRDEAFPISMYSVPIPSQTPFFPTDEPPDSTTGVLNEGFLPISSAIIVAKGNTVEEPAKLSCSLASAIPAIEKEIANVVITCEIRITFSFNKFNLCKFFKCHLLQFCDTKKN